MEQLHSSDLDQPDLRLKAQDRSVSPSGCGGQFEQCPKGFPMDFLWISYGFLMDFLWISYGFLFITLVDWW